MNLQGPTALYVASVACYTFGELQLKVSPRRQEGLMPNAGGRSIGQKDNKLVPGKSL